MKSKILPHKYVELPLADGHKKDCRVLLIDDQQSFLDLTRLLLEVEPGIHVIGEAHSGEEAIQLLSKFEPDGVVLDVQMPGINGFETARRLLEISPELRVIIMSSMHDREYESLAQSVGARAFFSKRDFSAENVARLLRGL